jgi:hypothetical protein
MKKCYVWLFSLAIYSSGFSQVVLNEVCASNGDIKYDPDFFDFPAWVELYNSGSSSVDVGGYHLSDDPSTITKWSIPSGTSIPAKGFLIIWCDSRNVGVHANFNLDPDGEDIILSNNGGAEISRISYPEQYINISYGSLSDGGSNRGYMVSPTPAAKNNPLTGTVRLNNPTLSLKSGRYSSPQTLSIGPEEQGVEIRYTTDGSEPTKTSTLYTSPVPIQKTTTVKATAYRDGNLPSKSEVKTYFINEHAFTLPVFALSTKPSYLTDNTIGIIVDGTNGITGNCNGQAKNWNQDWDRHAVMEYFENSGEKILDQHIDIRVHGGCSRNNPQKSLALRARDKFGSKTIEHEFFDSKQINNFGSIALRNGGNDFYYALFRDALMQTATIDQMDIDYQAYQPTILYLNGSYWGIETLREKLDADYFEANYGIDVSDLDLLEGGGLVLEGTRDRYNMYMDSLKRISLTSPAAYPFINRYIDVQEYINYITTELYYANTDWPGNNVKFWRQRSNNGKFRWVLWDLDFGMGLYQDASYPTHPTLDFATDPDNSTWPNPAWSTLHLRLLLQIPEFRKKLIQTMTTSLSTTFHPDRLISMIDAFQNTLKTEMPYHVQRWGLSMDNWNYEVERLRIFARERNTFLKSHIAAFFSLQNDVRLNLSTFPVDGGGVKLNGLLNSSVTDGFYYRDLPFELDAQPAPGFQFSHYKITKKEVSRVGLIEKGATWRYNDLGTLPSSDWYTESYLDASWSEGPAELGYGDTDEATVVGFGGNAMDKYITTYFRNTFTIADTAELSALSGGVLFDDGVVVYLNGEEVFRSNMPAGIIDNNTLALIGQPNETTFSPFTIPKGKVKPGANVVAVEIHQNSNSSSDISFALELSATKSGVETEFTFSDAKMSEIANSDVSVEAYFVPVTPKSGLVINEISADNSVIQDSFGDFDDWVEIYNNGTEAIDLANFFVTDNLGSKLKHKIRTVKDNETVINPGEYKLLWADDDVEQGPLHVSFRLSNDGEEFGIYQMVGTEVQKVDEVIFGEQSPVASFSRIPNITGNFSVTSTTTPLAENIYDTPTEVEGESQPGFSLYPNPTRGSFRLESKGGEMDIEIFNSTGKPIANLQSLQSGAEISIQDQPAGIFVIRVKTGGKVVVRRMVKI